MAVIGSSGSGKSTLARRLGEKLGAPVVELDALNWGPNWFNRSREDAPEFARRVHEAVAGDDWITDGNYTVIRPVILARATEMVWLDYSRLTIMSRVIRRSFSRAAANAELWPGTDNREDFERWFRKDHPIRWAWDTLPSLRARYEALFASDDWPHVARRRFKHPRETDAWLRSLPNNST